jgi:hypothetical protein
MKSLPELVQALRNQVAFSLLRDPRSLMREAADHLEAVQAGAFSRDFDDTVERAFRIQSRQFGDRQERTSGVVDHIKKEADEAKARPSDLVEWADIILLAIDGYRRNGGQSDKLLSLLEAKLDIVAGRTYPDPYATPDSVALEHDRSHDMVPVATELKDQDGHPVEMLVPRSELEAAATYEEIVATRPDTPVEAININTEYMLFQVCEGLTPYHRSQHEHLEAWFQREKWWDDLTSAQRKVVCDVEFRYD